MSYLKGILYALRGRVDYSYDCEPTETELDFDEFSERVSNDYADALELLAE